MLWLYVNNLRLRVWNGHIHLDNWYDAGCNHRPSAIFQNAINCISTIYINCVVIGIAVNFSIVI
jgi:hypothetical protein